MLAVPGTATHDIAQPIRGKADECRHNHDEREGNGEKEQRDKRAGGDRDGKPGLQSAAADTQHGLDNHGEHGSFEAEEQAGDDADIAPDDVNPTERHKRNDARHDEQNASDQTAARLVHEPANIDGELLRFRSRQEVAIIQRVEEASFGNPALFFDEDTMHDGDLSGWSSETQQRNTQPDLEGFGEADAMRRRDLVRSHRRSFCGHTHVRPPVAGIGQLWLSPTASRAQR